MATNIESDAEVLWSDVVDLMRQHDISPHIMAMLEACVPQDLTDEALIISASRFAKRRIQSEAATIEAYLEKAAFQPLKLEIINQVADASKIEVESTVTEDEVQEVLAPQQSTQQPVQMMNPIIQAPINYSPYAAPLTITQRREMNPLIEEISEGDSKLTFERFVEGDENRYAFQAAKQVANGENPAYKIIFIYGNSGLGKTHLLKAIQNYIAKNDQNRICLYRTSKDFQNDYLAALNDKEFSAKETLRRNYQDIDVLIIDDIQNLSGSATIQFFFDTFNYLTSEGKWIVLAADRTPRDLGLEGAKLDDRVVSRLASGINIPIQKPSDEFKYILIKHFYNQMKEDAEKENIPGHNGVISDENLQFMASKSGSNIRTISGFCSECLIRSSEAQNSGRDFGKEEIAELARARWGAKQASITIASIQKAVEDEFEISHDLLIGSSRKAEIKDARNAAIWLSRELTECTYEQIGAKFGGRSHATIIHSFDAMKKSMKNDRKVQDRVQRLKDYLIEDSYI